MSQLIFFVNGKKIVEKNANPEWTLLYYLRTKLYLCGTKLGCGEGGCGACTVMVSKCNRSQRSIKHYAINACLAPVCSMHGLSVTTVEGIGSTRNKLHPVQERIAKSHGTQCGFCTPGIVMSMYSLLRSNPKPRYSDLEATFQGNLCRCTGYRPILDGFKTFVEEWELNQLANTSSDNGVCSLGNDCCKNKNFETEKLSDPKKFAPYDPSQEPIFPPELTLYATLDEQSLVFRNSSEDVTWYRPISLDELLSLKFQHPDAKIIGGNTEVGVEVKFKNLEYPIRIHSVCVPELTEILVLNEGLKIGAGVSLQNVENVMKEQIELQPEYKTRNFVAMVEMLRWFAGKQIRNVATLGGNITTASPISDINPILIASKALLEIHSKTKGIRKVYMDDNFFTGYRKIAMQSDEVLVAILIFFTNEFQHIYAFKQSKRKDDDIAIVNSAISVEFVPNSDTIHEARVAYGGVASTTVVARRTQKSLVRKKWNSKMIESAYSNLLKDIQIPPHAPGGIVQYRKSLTLSFFFKTYLTILNKLQNNVVHSRHKSAIEDIHRRQLKTSQYFEIPEGRREKTFYVGKPLMHFSALKHSTGEATYCDDIPRSSNELYLAFVTSTRAHANITSIYTTDALSMEGVHDFLSADDLSPEENCVGLTRYDLMFFSKKVTAQGQIIGAIVAENELIAQKAAKKVKIVYEDLKPVIISIEQAVHHNSYFQELPHPKVLTNGDVDSSFRGSKHLIHGTSRTGGQEHFYLETQSVLVVPKNDGELEIHCSTQYATEVCKMVSKVVKLPQNKINVKVKRVGGAFGGKEHKPALLAIPAAMAALKFGRPVRCMLNRDEDIQIIGGRHPIFIQFRAACDDYGKILACEAGVYVNAGYSSELSEWVLERAMLHLENSYNIPNIRICGYVCKTNLPSNVAFRGFGAPQGMIVGELIIRKIADYLKMDPRVVARMNLYREGEITPYNQVLQHCTLTKCWDECSEMSNIAERKKDVEEFNKTNRWKKRGISMVPTKFGIAFGVVAMNQAGALIHVYTDGSVLLTHAGVEMGQGLHSKMIQIASTVLEISHEKICITETATDKVPNTSPTAASISSDLNGMAVLNACKTINERLQPYKNSNPQGSWEDWVLAAYNDRVSLSTTGFFKSEYEGFDFATKTGQCYMYFTYGVACSEVEIDCLTGDHQILRTDIVMDVGSSLNPAIDVGQIEGAFMQGYGLYMLEEMLFGPNGTVLTRGPGTYKLPSFGNVPAEFNVSLLKGAPNPRAVYSSKAIGEPPLFLASSVFFATREAIKSARCESGASQNFELHAPLTPDKIRMACEDHITCKVKVSEKYDFIPWNVTP